MRRLILLAFLSSFFEADLGAKARDFATSGLPRSCVQELASFSAMSAHAAPRLEDFVQGVVDQVLIPAFEEFNIRREQTLDLLKDPLRASLKLVPGAAVGALGPLLSVIQRAVIDRGAEAQALFSSYFQNKLEAYLTSLETSESNPTHIIETHAQIEHAWKKQTNRTYAWMKRDRNRNFFVLGTQIGEVDLFDPRTKEIHRWLDASHPIHWRQLYQWDQSHSRLYMTSEGDSEVRCFAFKETEPCSRFQWKSHPFLSISLSPGGEYLLGVHKTRKLNRKLISIWDTDLKAGSLRRAPLKVIEVHYTKRIDAIALSPHLKFLAYNGIHEGGFQTTEIVDFESEEYLGTETTLNSQKINQALTFTPDSRILAHLSFSNRLSFNQFRHDAPKKTWPLQFLDLQEIEFPQEIQWGERKDSILVKGSHSLGVWKWDTRQRIFQSERIPSSMNLWAADFSLRDQGILYSATGHLLYHPLVWPTENEDAGTWESSPLIEPTWAKSWWLRFKYRLRGDFLSE